ncbi:Proline-, glutamic acid- and leucine-rich protein 1 [Glycine soja]
MAAFDHFGNMYDVAFKPRLLQTLIRDHLPDEKRPFSNPSELSKVVSLIKTHSLLSESFADSTRPKLIEAWKSALASWLNLIYSLLSTTMPDKCWAGISLLGVTCEECSSERFLESYSVWFQKLLSFLQSPADSHLVRVAACASMSDLFARLGGYPKIKKDSSSCAVKVVQPTLKILNDENSEAIWDAAVHLLCTIITSFPFSIRNHYDSVESAIALKLLSGGCSLDMSKKLAHCLTLLPKSKGDEESWSVMMQKILVLINDQLNLAFHGLEEETLRNEVTRLLVLPGKHPPPPLGGYILAEEVLNKASKTSEQSLMSNASRLMFGCCLLLKNSYPVKVNVPVRLLLGFVERILMVNGSLPQMSLPFMTAKQQENICSELPVLHLSSLELLTAIIKAMGSQLLPHAAYIVRIITKYFKTCKLPELRIKVYSVTRNLLITMGVGMALYLAQEVINNAFADLSIIEHKNSGILNGSNSNASAGALLLPIHRKRKHSSTTGSLQEHGEGGLSVEVPKNRPLTPVSLRIAALETLESLITVAGALKSEPWRSKVDSLLLVTAMDSFKEGSVSEERSVFQQKEPAATTTELQLAALRALLVSLLSFARVRPPYLAQGLELFRRGRQQTGTKLAEFCAHALLTLEVLIHPRALPMVDYAYANNSSFGEAHSNLQHGYFGWSHNTPYGLPQVPPDYDDDLCARWLENDNEVDESLDKNTKYTQEPSEACRASDPEVLLVHVSSDTNIQERIEMVSETATCADVEMKTVEDETNFKSDKPGESVVQFQETVSCTTNIPVVETRGDVADDKVSEKIFSDNSIPHNEASHMESRHGSSVNKDFKFSSPSSSLWHRTSGSNIFEEFAFQLEHDKALADEDDFPDIVDGDPDSDTE